MGLGSLGGGTQLLFGGSGGQDLFQKITWTLGITFMIASLVLAKMKKPSTSRYLQAIEKKAAAQAQEQAQAALAQEMATKKETSEPAKMNAKPAKSADVATNEEAATPATLGEIE